MPTVKLTIFDDQGNIISDADERTYQLSLVSENFDAIETAVANFKNQALPDIQSDLLTQLQQDFIQKKTENLKCNGTMPVMLKTLHGTFKFKLQRFMEKNCDHTQSTYFELTNQFGQGYISCRLKEFSASQAVIVWVTKVWKN